MVTKIQKWGNSQGLRLPKHILDSVDLEVGDDIEVSINDNQIIIQKIASAKSKYNLENLLSRIPPNHQPTEESFGAATGKEEW